MLMLTYVNTRVFAAYQEMWSLMFECSDPDSTYYGKHFVMAHWSLEHPLAKPATHPCWDAFGRVLLAN